jgi:o-succinylbenzoate synthase
MQASYKRHILDFKRPGGTSRGIMTQKETWFITLRDNEHRGIGECGLFRGLSKDDRPDYEERLKWACNHIDLGQTRLLEELEEFPSIQFGLEMAFLSLNSTDGFTLFPSRFTSGQAAISINGLIWMGDKTFMKHQVEEKLSTGFTCIKMKIGAIDFDDEFNLIKSIREEYGADEVELRVDANGAFAVNEALEKLKKLSELDLHSIEQPIAPGNYEAMALLCEKSPLDIALDEELIGVYSAIKKQILLKTINPQYIILKPSLIGGFRGSEEWIELAEQCGIGWWVTSALESNIGLSAIAQWTFSLGTTVPQGLGTGALFTNNFLSPLRVKNGTLRYEPEKHWKLII